MFWRLHYWTKNLSDINLHLSFCWGTFVLLFEDLLVFLDVTLFFDSLIWRYALMAVLFIPLLSFCQWTNQHAPFLFFFFTYLAVWKEQQLFLVIIVSSVLGDAFVAAHLDYLQYVHSFGFFSDHLELIVIWIWFYSFYEKNLKKIFKDLCVYFAIFVVINFLLYGLVSKRNIKNLGVCWQRFGNFLFVSQHFIWKSARSSIVKI